MIVRSSEFWDWQKSCQVTVVVMRNGKEVHASESMAFYIMAAISAGWKEMAQAQNNYGMHVPEECPYEIYVRG